MAIYHDLSRRVRSLIEVEKIQFGKPISVQECGHETAKSRTYEFSSEWQNQQKQGEKCVFDSAGYRLAGGTTRLKDARSSARGIDKVIIERYFRLS